MTDETERPSIEFDGTRYERQRGSWIEVRTQMKASVYLSQKIDIRARMDPAFWDRCCDQDFADDPKNSGKILIRLPDTTTQRFGPR